MLHIKGHVEIKASNLHRVSASVKAQARLGPPSGRRLSTGADAGKHTLSPTEPCPPRQLRSQQSARAGSAPDSTSERPALNA